MTNTAIAKILDVHCVPFYTECGHIYADSMYAGTALFAEVVDLTNYTMRQLYNWLGY